MLLGAERDLRDIGAGKIEVYPLNRVCYYVQREICVTSVQGRLRGLPSQQGMLLGAERDMRDIRCWED